MGGFFNQFRSKINQNGISPELNQFEKEKLGAFNWQIFICIVVSFQFILLALFYRFHLLTFFSVTYFLLFSSTYFCIYKNHRNFAKYIYLFTTNYAVFSITFCLGYESGFYFYFFTTPLTVYVTFGNSKPVFIYLSLLSYLINSITLNYLYHHGMIINPGVLNSTATIILFNFNLFTAFFMIYMFVDSFIRFNRLNTQITEELHLKQRLLESEIYQKQLDEAKTQYLYQKLESEYQQLDMFSHIISHNLRGPISRVSGLLELLKEFPVASEEQQKLMDHMNSSVLMIDEVIKDLNYILVQKRLGQESTVEMNIQDILDEVKILLSEEIKFSRAIINEKYQVEKIKCIKSIMVSIFYNLISNSIKYAMPNQKPVIHIGALISDQTLIINYKDEGMGFDSDKYGDKLFRLYTRFHNHVEGKGIGLFLVKSHVDMLDGKIFFKSIPRKGVKFTIHLPIKENYFSPVFFNKFDSEKYFQ